MRCAVMLCLLAFAGCRSAAKEPGPTHAEPPPPITATPPTASPMNPTPPPTTGTRTPPAAAPPFVTPPPGLAKPPAPEAASASEAGACQKDGDCALTYVPETGCCPTLCAPRGVTVAESRRRQEMVQQCEQGRGHPCPVPACRARAFQAACVAGACTARPANTD